MLQSPQIRSNLARQCKCFVHQDHKTSIIYELNNVNKSYQRDCVDIGLAYSDLVGLTTILGRKILKPALDNNFDVLVKALANENAFLKPEECNYNALKNLESSNRRC